MKSFGPSCHFRHFCVTAHVEELVFTMLRVGQVAIIARSALAMRGDMDSPSQRIPYMGCFLEALKYLTPNKTPLKPLESDEHLLSRAPIFVAMERKVQGKGLSRTVQFQIESVNVLLTKRTFTNNTCICFRTQEKKYRRPFISKITKGKNTRKNQSGNQHPSKICECLELLFFLSKNRRGASPRLFSSGEGYEHKPFAA